MRKKLVVVKEGLDDTYEEITFQRLGWMGRNKLTGAHELLPMNAFEIMTFEKAYPMLEFDIQQMVEKAVTEAIERHKDDLKPAKRGPGRPRKNES